MSRLLYIALGLAVCCAVSSCKNDDPNPSTGGGILPPPEVEDSVYNPAMTPKFVYDIKPYSGRMADDLADDLVTDDKDLYHEHNDWEVQVTVTYTETSASVTGVVSPMSVKVDGAHVSLDIADKYAKIVLTGASSAGSLRVDGLHRHMIQLESLNLTSDRGPAINDQNKKCVFLHLEGDSRLTDSPVYAPAANPEEDRKGCFFSEGHVIVSGSGSLSVKGRQRHGFATDGFLTIRPGATLVVTDAAKNAIHVKGGASAGYGVRMIGGYVYANTSAPAGKALKSDMRIMVYGGQLDLNCSGDPAMDLEDNTLSSAACMKADGDIDINAGKITLTATGDGGKGINSDGSLTLRGGVTTIALSGEHLSGDTDTSTSKGVKTNGNINGLGGVMNISAIGGGSIGVDCVGAAALNGSIIYSFGSSYGLRIAGALTLNDGTLLAGGEKNDVADVAGKMRFVGFDGIAVSHDTTTGVYSVEDGKLCGTFFWPFDISSASLRFSSSDLSAEGDYEIR